MNTLDIVILAVLAAFLLKGLWRGLLREVCAVAGLLAGAILAFRFCSPLGEVLSAAVKLPPKAAAVVSFLALFVSTVLFFAVLGFLLSRFVRLLFLGGLNRVAGGLFGLTEGVLLLAIVLFGVSQIDLPGAFGRSFRDSRLAPPFVHLGKAAFKESRHLFAGWR